VLWRRAGQNDFSLRGVTRGEQYETLSISISALRSADCDLTARAVYAQQEVLPKIDVIRLDSRFDKLVPSNVKIEKIAGGHNWVEGSVWNRKEGFLLFSDITNNSIYKWQESKGESLFLKPSG
jgi:hypothetical protein